MRKFNCPYCRKTLIRLEPFRRGWYDFWCDKCDVTITIGDHGKIKNNSKVKEIETK